MSASSALLWRAAKPKYPFAVGTKLLFIDEPWLTLVLATFGISVAIAPVALAIGKVEV